MSHALLGLENASADFKNQKATLRPLSKTSLLLKVMSDSNDKTKVEKFLKEHASISYEKIIEQAGNKSFEIRFANHSLTSNALVTL